MKPKLKRMQTELENSNEEQKLLIATEYFREALQLGEKEAQELLKPCIKIIHLEENRVLFEEGNFERTDAIALGMVISGVLKLTQESPFSDNFEIDDAEKEKDLWCAFIHTRELVGGLQVNYTFILRYFI
jgi:hypothetical protein